MMSFRTHRAVDIVYFHFLHFFTKIKKNYQKGPQHACSTNLFKHLLQQLWNYRQDLEPIFLIVRNLMMGTPGKGNKSVI